MWRWFLTLKSKCCKWGDAEVRQQGHRDWMEQCRLCSIAEDSFHSFFEYTPGRLLSLFNLRFQQCPVKASVNTLSHWVDPCMDPLWSGDHTGPWQGCDDAVCSIHRREGRLLKMSLYFQTSVVFYCFIIVAILSQVTATEIPTFSTK